MGGGGRGREGGAGDGERERESDGNMTVFLVPPGEALAPRTGPPHSGLCRSDLFLVVLIKNCSAQRRDELTFRWNVPEKPTVWRVDGYRVKEEDGDGRPGEAVPPLPETKRRIPVIPHVYFYDRSELHIIIIHLYLYIIIIIIIVVDAGNQTSDTCSFQ